MRFDRIPIIWITVFSRVLVVLLWLSASGMGAGEVSSEEISVNSLRESRMPSAIINEAKDYSNNTKAILSSSQVSLDKYFSKLKSLSPSEFESKMNGFISNFEGQLDDSEKIKVLAKLSEVREGLPHELKWFLSALQIKYKLIDDNVVVNAREALTSAHIIDSYGLRDGWQGSDTIFYKLPYDERPSRFKFRSQETAIEMFRWWSLLPIYRKELLEDEFWKDSLLEWLDHIASNTSRFTLKLALELLSDFDELGQDGISALQEKVAFYKSLKKMIRYTLDNYGQYDYVGENQFVARGSKYFEDYELIRRKVKGWIKSDLSFLLNEFTFLSGRNLLSPEEILERNLDVEDLNEIDHVLSFEKGLVESKWIASILRLKIEDTYGVGTSGTAREIAFKGILEAEKWQNGIRLHDEEGDRYLRPDFYNEFTMSFFRILSHKKNMSKSEIESLTKYRPLRTKDMSDSSWYELERTRLKALSGSVSKSKMVEYLYLQIEGVKGGTNLLEKVAAADILRNGLGVSDSVMSSLIARYKDSLRRPSLIDRIRNRKADFWQDDSRDIVRILSLLRPGDKDLVAYLDGIYLSGSEKGGVSPKDARNWMAKVHRVTPKVQRKMVSSLKQIKTGDSSTELRSLLKSGYIVGEDIIEIIYVHRSSPKKIVPMLLVLVEEIERSPVILESILKGMNSGRAKVSRALYGGLSLDQWLIGTLNDRGNKHLKSGGRCAKSI